MTYIASQQLNVQRISVRVLKQHYGLQTPVKQKLDNYFGELGNTGFGKRASIMILKMEGGIVLCLILGLCSSIVSEAEASKRPPKIGKIYR